MSVLDGFYATWTKARNTFGEGTPNNGDAFNQSAKLRQFRALVDAAAPGSHWRGTAADAYGAANTAHGEVFEKLAKLDQQLSTLVGDAAKTVESGRNNLDAVRQWVTDAANAVPPGKNRENLLTPIVQKGLGQVTEVVETSNTKLNAAAQGVRALGDQYTQLTDQKFAPKTDNPAVQNVKDDGEGEKTEEEKAKERIDDATEQGRKDGDSLGDGQLSAEESQRLKDATNLSPEQKTQLDNGNVTIPPERMAYLNGLSNSLDGKSPAEIKAALGKLPPEEAKAVSNGLHLIGSDRVETTPPDPSAKPGDAGYVPEKGGKEALPKSFQEIFDAPLLDTYGDDGAYDPNKPLRYLDEYRDIAAISELGDPALQRSSALNEGLLAQSREMLEWSEHTANPSYQGQWSTENIDPTLQTLLSAGSHDPVAVHDLVAGADGKSPNNGFISDVYEHAWQDDGRAAGSLFPPNSDEMARAGEVMHAFDKYAGEHYKELLNIDGKQSLGEINPALTQALAQANVPYLDDMVLANDDGSKGYGSLDGLDAAGGNPDMPVTRGLFAVIDSDPKANEFFGATAVNEWRGLIGEYSQSLVDGRVPDTGSLQAAGYLQRMMDQGEFLHQYDLSGDSNAAAVKAMEARGMWYDAFHDAVGFVPRADTAVEIYDAMPGDVLRDFFVGAPPDFDQPQLQPKNVNEVMHLAASYAVAQGAGNLGLLGDQLRSGPDGTWLTPFEGNNIGASQVNAYLSGLAGGNDLGWLLYTSAYDGGLDIPQDELDDLKNQGS